jgi:hypothetical protein
MENVVVVTQNWSFDVPKLGPDLDKSVADFEVCFQPFHSAKTSARFRKFGARFGKIGARFCRQQIK